MTNYEKMKMAEKYDEDCEEAFGNDLEEAEKYETQDQKMRRKYKEFYTDIKLSHREDW